MLQPVTTATDVAATSAAMPVAHGAAAGGYGGRGGESIYTCDSLSGAPEKRQRTSPPTGLASGAPPPAAAGGAMYATMAGATGGALAASSAAHLHVQQLSPASGAMHATVAGGVLASSSADAPQTINEAHVQQLHLQQLSRARVAQAQQHALAQDQRLRQLQQAQQQARAPAHAQAHAQAQVQHLRQMERQAVAHLQQRHALPQMTAGGLILTHQGPHRGVVMPPEPARPESASYSGNQPQQLRVSPPAAPAASSSSPKSSAEALGFFSDEASPVVAKPLRAAPPVPPPQPRTAQAPQPGNVARAAAAAQAHVPPDMVRQSDAQSTAQAAPRGGRPQAALPAPTQVAIQAHAHALALQMTAQAQMQRQQAALLPSYAPAQQLVEMPRHVPTTAEVQEALKAAEAGVLAPNLAAALLDSVDFQSGVRPKVFNPDARQWCFKETPKRGQIRGREKIDRWRNSGGVRGGSDVPPGNPVVRRRYGGVYRDNTITYRYHEYVPLRRVVGESGYEQIVEDRSSTLFHVLPGKVKKKPEPEAQPQNRGTLRTRTKAAALEREQHMSAAEMLTTLMGL